MMWPFALAVSLVLPFISFSLAHDAHLGKRHHVYRQDDLARRDISCTGARFTYFADGLGACGTTNQPSDFIVALDATQFSLDLCFQTISITVGGQTLSAAITDRCESCPNCGLDFSQGLFEAFGSLSLGVLEGDWVLGSGGSSAPSSSAPPPAPSPTTSTSSWAPTPTSQPPPTSSSSTTVSSSTTASSSNSSVVPTQTSSSILALPSGITPGETTGSSVLADLDLYLVLFAGLLESCSSPQ